MMLRMSSLMQCSLILLIFAHLLVSGLSDGSNGTSQKTKIESNVTKDEVTKVISKNITDTQNGDKNEKATGVSETDNEEVAKPVEVDDEAKPSNPVVKDINPIDPTDTTNSSKIETSSIKPSTSTSTETTKINIESSNENKTEPETVTEISATSTISESNTESSANPTTTNSTEKSEAIDAPMQEQLAAANPIGPKPEDMSSGVVALVMAIVFAVVVIIIYVGLLGWRRYLEYRYGNRELLVNDLEFDTNDLRHFEL